MFVGSLQSAPWARSLSSSSAEASPPAAGAFWNAIPTSPSGAAAPAQGGFGPAAPNTPGSNQNVAGTATGAGPQANPLQNLAADIQALLIQGGSGASAGAASGSAGSTPTSQPGTHHHYHHHHGAAAGSAAAAGSSPSGNSYQAVSRAIAVDIGQALRAYAGGSSAAASSPSA